MELDIGPIERRLAAFIEGAFDQRAFYGEDVPALIMEVRRLRRAMACQESEADRAPVLQASKPVPKAAAKKSRSAARQRASSTKG